MPKKKRHTSSQVASKTPQQLLDALDEADSLMSRDRWAEARAILEPLNQRYPHRYDVLAGLSNVYHALREERRYLEVCEQLVKLAPRDPDIALMLAGAYLINLMPILALRTFRDALERWPDHPRAIEVRRTAAELEERVGNLLADLRLSGDAAFELAALHEEARALLAQARYAEARKVEEQLLHHRPDFTPALNNIGVTYAVEGQLDQAITTARRVLALDPDNFHALANLVRFSCLSGRVDEAREWAERLKAVESNALDVWVKQAEALSFIADDQGVLDAFAGAERAGHLKPPMDDPLLYHLAAVAAMRQGREDAARRYWRQALKLAPGFEPAQANLDDLGRPVGERHAPWPYTLAEWMTQKSMRDLTAQLDPAIRRGKMGAIVQAAQRYLRLHPEVVALTPMLLEYGDPEARMLAFHIASTVKTPELLAALHDFALSRNGPDALRNQAALLVFQAGLLPSRRVTMWLGGEWREIVLMSYTIHEEQIVVHQPRVEKLLSEGVAALRRNNPNRAEPLFTQALEIEPDAPDLLNNLAVAYNGQRRGKEAEALIHQIIEHYPDYVFARVSMARTYILRGKIAEAKALLEPLLDRDRFHVMEFANFCAAEIELHIAEGNSEVARSWLDMWANVDPDHPAIEDLRLRLDRAGPRQRTFGKHA